jgi:hypothetical protein
MKDITPEQLARLNWLRAARDSFGLTDAEAEELARLEEPLGG